VTQLDFLLRQLFSSPFQSGRSSNADCYIITRPIGASAFDAGVSVLKALLLPALVVLAHASSLLAQETNQTEHGDHDNTADEIVVTGAYRRDQNDILSGTSVISAEKLTRQLKPTIGETLSHQAGVSATSFGPNASRPVLRGFQGERVRVLSDGIGSFDVSNTSVDHAVVINPLTADRIEVLRGPASLQFGSSAIGGVVNVIDSRIPRKIPEEGIHVDGLVTYGSAANERAGGVRLDLPISEKIVAHFDGTYTKTGNLRTGGFILSSQIRAAALASGDPAITSLAALKGKLPNSAGRTWDVAGGAALITSTGNLGFSVSHYDSLYGVPVRFSLDPAVEAEAVRLDVKQTRVDLRSEINPDSGFIEAIKFRGGFADYRHNEVDESGAIGTTFFNQGWEGRLELVQRAKGGWRGATGAQFFLRDLNIIGDEKFLPKSTVQQFGLFTLQSFDLGQLRGEGGVRIERSTLKANADDDLGNPDLSRSFTALSGSLGASFEVTTGWRVGLNGSYTQRAPSAEELFANGPHAGTQAFEIGDPAFAKEKSTSLELVLRGKGEGYSLSASLYKSWFRDFIFDAATGAVEDGLPVFQSLQADARYYGAEIEASLDLARIGNTAVRVDGVGDFNRAKVRSAGPIPRIPALRLLGGLEAQSPTVTGRVEIEWVGRQARVAAFETPTPGYELVNASVSFKPFGADNAASITLSANNIFDITARRHASFLKDFAPLAGCDIRLTIKAGF
jgi:iron complex outermembrane recepter protein